MDPERVGYITEMLYGPWIGRWAVPQDPTEADWQKLREYHAGRLAARQKKAARYHSRGLHLPIQAQPTPVALLPLGSLP